MVWGMTIIKDMKEPKYRYAYSQGKKVDINDVKESDRKNGFVCIGCKQRLVPVSLDKERIPHFRHYNQKNCIERCAPNTYLHNLAQDSLKERFEDMNTPFFVKVPGYRTCQHHCELFEADFCREDCICQIDLHSLYDTCEKEKTIYLSNKDRFIADLALINSKDNTIKPMLIEIRVHHQNTVKKRCSGFEIMEIRIPIDVTKGEEKIHNICASEVFDFEKDEAIRLDGFIPRYCGEKGLEKKTAFRMALGEKYVWPIHKISCNKLHKDIEGDWQFNVVKGNGKYQVEDENCREFVNFHLEKLGFIYPRNCKNCIGQNPILLGYCKCSNSQGHPCQEYAMSQEKREYFEKLWSDFSFIVVNQEQIIPEEYKRNNKGFVDGKRGEDKTIVNRRDVVNQTCVSNYVYRGNSSSAKVIQRNCISCANAENPTVCPFYNKFCDPQNCKTCNYYKHTSILPV